MSADRFKFNKEFLDGSNQDSSLLVNQNQEQKQEYERYQTRRNIMWSKVTLKSIIGILETEGKNEMQNANKLSSLVILKAH